MFIAEGIIRFGLVFMYQPSLIIQYQCYPCKKGIKRFNNFPQNIFPIMKAIAPLELEHVYFQVTHQPVHHKKFTEDKEYKRTLIYQAFNSILK